MISFACNCKHRFELPDDRAGDVIQCPNCGRLNDIPTLDDLPYLDADGVFDIYADRPVDNPSRLAELGILYTADGKDADGDEVDLRLPAGRKPIEDDGIIPLAGDDEEDAPKSRPKYDPETGELIRPLELKEDPDHPNGRMAIPLAQPVINYATAYADFQRVSPWKILIELFAPPNMMVMGFYLLFTLITIVMGLIVFYGFFFIAIAPAALVMAMIAHLGIVVEEVGPEEQDELPRLMRGFSLYDDLWQPFCRVTISVVLSFLPFWFALDAPPSARFAMVLVGVAVGCFFFPAVLLTMLTSGTWLNLRPDRIGGVIRAARAHYVVAVVGVVVAIPALLIGMDSVACSMWNGFANPAIPIGGLRGKAYIAFPLLLTGIYLVHAWAWYLGLIYRAHHGQFPWILQRHISTRRTHLDPATDFKGRAQRPKRTTEEKLQAARATNARRYEGKA